MSRASFSGQLRSLRRRLRDRYGQPAPALFADPSPPTLPPPSESLRARLARVAEERPALGEALSRLDAWQLAALFSEEPAVLVRAQAGSGKTGLLAAKVRLLQEVEGVAPERILALTFTCKAARELRQRVGAGERLWAGTFHALARRLVGGEVIDRDALQALWQELIERHGLSIRYRNKLARRVEAYGRGQPLYGNMRHPDDIGRLVELAEQACLEQGLLDFDDLLAEASAALRHRALDPAPAYVLVDELQDCDAAQLALLGGLAEPGTRLFAVGDPNQAIYAWRGSTPALFEAFRSRHRATLYSLPVNYRCSGSIAACARVFLREGELVPTRERGEPIRIVRHHGPASEARYLAGRLAELQASGQPLDQVGILVRLREQLEPLCEVLAGVGLPVERLSLQTIHGAKGLEFDHVFLCGANDGILPLGGSGADPALLAEEQRLFHVALTRARDRLEISWYTDPGQRRFRPHPSPFLRMLPSNLVEWTLPVAGKPPGAEEEQGWAVGQSARHRRYGTGRVSAVDGQSVTVSFDRYGSKKFSLAACPLVSP